MVKGFIQEIDRQYSRSFKTPEELFRNLDVPFEELKGGDSTMVYSVDFDGCGKLDTLYISEPTIFGRSIGVIFNKTAEELVKRKEFDNGNHCADDVYSFENDKIVSNVFLADVNGDDLKDIVIGTESGIKVFLNVTLINTVCALKKEPAYFTAVPDYDRTGRVHVSTGSFQHYEKLTDSLVNKHDFVDLFPASTARYLHEHLPEQFYVGSFSTRRDLFGSAPGLPERLAEQGIAAVADDGHHWIQDYDEFALVKGVSAGVLARFYNDNRNVGGNIFFVRNDRKELFVTMTEEMVRDSILWIGEDQNICLSKNDKVGLEEYLSVLTGEKMRVLIFPEVIDFAHIDQVAFFPLDGKVILVDLPDGHPQKAQLQVAKRVLKNSGFEIVAEIPLPQYNFDEGVSPLNIFVHRSPENGDRKYLVPMEPKLYIDARVGVGSDITVINGSEKFDTGEASNFSDEYFIYDPTDIPQHTQAVVEALVRSGVRSENIVLFPDNGLGKGGLHCKTNTEPK